MSSASATTCRSLQLKERVMIGLVMGLLSILSALYVWYVDEWSYNHLFLISLYLFEFV